MANSGSVECANLCKHTHVPGDFVGAEDPLACWVIPPVKKAISEYCLSRKRKQGERRQPCLCRIHLLKGLVLFFYVEEGERKLVPKTKTFIKVVKCCFAQWCMLLCLSEHLRSRNMLEDSGCMYECTLRARLVNDNVSKLHTCRNR